MTKAAGQACGQVGPRWLSRGRWATHSPEVPWRKWSLRLGSQAQHRHERSQRALALERGLGEAPGRSP